MLVAPYLLTGMTDSRHYAPIASGRVFRFAPFAIDRAAGDLKRVHGVDERLGVENYVQVCGGGRVWQLVLLCVGVTPEGGAWRG